MKKLIMMAIAGFVWRKVQGRMLKQTQTGGGVRRY